MSASRRAWTTIPGCACAARARLASTAVLPAICTWSSALPRTRCSSAKARISSSAGRYPWSKLPWGIVLEVPTLDDPVNLDIPAGTQSGEVFRLRGLGIPHLGSSQNGDLLIIVKVKTPTRLTDRQKELLNEFAEIEREEAGKFKNKAKDFFKKAKDKVMGSRSWLTHFLTWMMTATPAWWTCRKRATPGVPPLSVAWSGWRRRRWPS